MHPRSPQDEGEGSVFTTNVSFQTILVLAFPSIYHLFCSLQYLKSRLTSVVLVVACILSVLIVHITYAAVVSSMCLKDA